MARPLRIEFPGALYHITARGDRKETIYDDDGDHRLFLETLSHVVGRFNWLCHAYCLMPNHYHLLVETPEANLSKGMRQLNGVFTQASNRRHGRSGHLFQGRFKGVLVDGESYLLELSRYVVLNPVRAGLVAEPEAWPWSSYRAMVGAAAAAPWLATAPVLAHFGGVREEAQRRYRAFVQEGIGGRGVWHQLRQQVYLGGDRFVERAQAQARSTRTELRTRSVPQVQRRAPVPPLAAIAAAHNERDAAIVAAYATGAYSYRQIGEFFGLHLGTIGRIVRRQMLQSETSYIASDPGV